MFWRHCVILIVGALIGWNVVKCAPAEVAKNKEKVRSYEFGFNIEESHHRHEKRDENGIVMGEFGFITADGIYHVTVYATDENGKFKILAMKSYPYGNPEKKNMVATLPPVSRPVVVPQIRQQTALGTPSCGGCILTKKLVPERDSVDPEAVFRPLSKTINDGPISRTPSAAAGSSGSKGFSSLTPLQPKTNSNGVPKTGPSLGFTASKAPSGSAPNGKEYQLTNSNAISPSTAQGPAARQSKTIGTVAPQGLGVRFGALDAPKLPNPFSPIATQAPYINSQFGAKPNLPSSSNKPSLLPVQNGNPSQQGLRPLQNTFTPNIATRNELPTVNSRPTPDQSSTPRIQNTFQSSIPSNTPRIQNTIKSSNQNTKTLQSTSPVIGITPNKPITPPTRIQTQNTNVANTPTANLPSTSKLTPGVPPPSFSQSIGKVIPSSNGGGPLYRFKYVLDYNSHREEGRIDGSQEGNYKTIDEDGVRRIIDYVANENGFQPHIKWQRIPSNEVPTGENKLKEYEFVWFH